MAEDRAEMNSLHSELNRLAIMLQKITGDIEGYAREQERLRDNLAEMRNGMKDVIRLLREGGDGNAMSIVTRLVVVERRLDSIESAKTVGQARWFHVVGNLGVASIIIIAGAFLGMYMAVKGLAVKP